jgi:acylphosphatase
MRRATAIISGRIQAVGYRNIVDTVAYAHKINGYVKNLKDRTVEVVAEGHESSLKAFFDDIRIDEFPIHVDTISITWDDPTNEYTYFDIIRGDPSEEIGERIDVANILLVNMNKKQDIMIEKQDIMIEKQDQMIGLQYDTNSEIKGLRIDTKNYLDNRFSKIQSELTDRKSASVKDKAEI